MYYQIYSYIHQVNLFAFLYKIYFATSRRSGIFHFQDDLHFFLSSKYETGFAFLSSRNDQKVWVL